MKIRKSLLVMMAIAMVAALGTASAEQPRMEAALNSLQAAHYSLEHAEHNKGGHRERALELIDRAIAEVRAGMASAR